MDANDRASNSLWQCSNFHRRCLDLLIRHLQNSLIAVAAAVAVDAAAVAAAVAKSNLYYCYLNYYSNNY